MPNCDLLIVIPAAGVGADPHTGDAQPEHATGGWGVVIHPPTTLVSRAGQVCVPFGVWGVGCAVGRGERAGVRREPNLGVTPVG